MVPGAITLFVAAAVLVILGISFAVDISKGVGPGLSGATVDSRNPSRTYTFVRIESKGIAIFVTVLVFLLAAGGIVGGIVVLATG